MTITGHKIRSVGERYNIVDQRDIREALRQREANFGHSLSLGHNSAIIEPSEPNSQNDRVQ